MTHTRHALNSQIITALIVWVSVTILLLTSNSPMWGSLVVFIILSVGIVFSASELSALEEKMEDLFDE